MSFRREAGRRQGAKRQPGASRGALASRARGHGGPRGRRRSSDRRPSAWAGDKARSPAGVDIRQPLKARTAGPADVLRDVTWSGVTVRTDRMPSGLPGHPRLAPRGSCDTGGSLLLHFPKGVFTLLLSGPQNPRDARNGATQLMPGTSNPGLLQVGLALNRDMLHSGTTTPPDSGIGSGRLSRRSRNLLTQHRRHHRKSSTRTTPRLGDSIFPATPCSAWGPPPAKPSWGGTAPPPPPSSVLLPPFLVFSFLSFLSFLCLRDSTHLRLRPPSLLSSICTKSLALVWSRRQPESLRASVCVRAASLASAAPAPACLSTSVWGRPGAAV